MIIKKWILILTVLLLLTGCQTSSNNNIFEETTKIENIQNEINTNLPSEDTSSQTTDNTYFEKEPVNEHEYHCDKFLLTVDGNQIDLTTINPELSSVSELYPIADEQLYILGRVNENYNSLMVYDFTKKEIIFSEHGTTMCWVQGKFEAARYLKDNIVYDLDGNIIYQPVDGKLVNMIEYVIDDFMVTVTDLNYENPEEIWIE